MSLLFTGEVDLESGEEATGLVSITVCIANTCFSDIIHCSFRQKIVATYKFRWKS